MKVRYEFANGDVSVVEVSEDIGEMIMSSRREEESALRQQRRYCCSLYDMDYEGEYFADYHTPESEYEEKIRSEKIRAALASLTDTQRRRLMMLVDGMTLREIAIVEGASHKNVWKSIEQAKEKIKSFINEG